MSATDNNLINQMQAMYNYMAKLSGERTRATREMGVPHPAVTGGTGDPDQRRFMDPVLQGQMLIQRAMNGWQNGAVTINQAPVVYKQNLPVLTNQCGPSLWGQTRITPGVVPFLSTTPFVAQCGQTAPSYNGGPPPSMQTPASTTDPPALGTNPPASWP